MPAIGVNALNTSFLYIFNAIDIASVYSNSGVTNVIQTTRLDLGVKCIIQFQSVSSKLWKLCTITQGYSSLEKNLHAIPSI